MQFLNGGKSFLERKVYKEGNIIDQINADASLSKCVKNIQSIMESKNQHWHIFKRKSSPRMNAFNAGIKFTKCKFYKYIKHFN